MRISEGFIHGNSSDLEEVGINYYKELARLRSTLSYMVHWHRVPIENRRLTPSTVLHLEYHMKFLAWSGRVNIADRSMMLLHRMDQAFVAGRCSMHTGTCVCFSIMSSSSECGNKLMMKWG